MLSNDGDGYILITDLVMEVPWEAEPWRLSGENRDFLRAADLPEAA